MTAAVRRLRLLVLLCSARSGAFERVSIDWTFLDGARGAAHSDRPRRRAPSGRH
jgi:hypothetical protein